MQGKKLLSVNLPIDLHTRLKKVAQKTETTITEIVIKGILRELSLRSREKTKEDDDKGV